MGAAAKDLYLGERQRRCRSVLIGNMAPQRFSLCGGPGMKAGKRRRNNGIAAKPFLQRRVVKRQQDLVDIGLACHVDPGQGPGDGPVEIGACLGHVLAADALAAIAAFDGFPCSAGGARGRDGANHRAVLKCDLCLDGRDATRIPHPTADQGCNPAH